MRTRSRSESDTSSSSTRRRRPHAAKILGALCACLAFAPLPAGAKVFFAQDEALELAFPGADRVEERVFFLKPSQKRALEKQARSGFDSGLTTVFVGWSGEELLGYAQIDVHPVRSQPEALMVVLSRQGTVTSIRVLAFHEPLDYLPAKRWFRQFVGATQENTLRLGGDIHGVSGATLSAQAVTASVRRFLAIYRVLLEPGAQEK